MLLSKLIERGDSTTSDAEISAITVDSRAVKPGSLFAAMPGSVVDGIRFVPDAVAAGASALLVADDAVVDDVTLPVVRSQGCAPVGCQNGCTVLRRSAANDCSGDRYSWQNFCSFLSAADMAFR